MLRIVKDNLTWTRFKKLNHDKKKNFEDFRHSTYISFYILYIIKANVFIELGNKNFNSHIYYHYFRCFPYYSGENWRELKNQTVSNAFSKFNHNHFNICITIDLMAIKRRIRIRLLFSYSGSFIYTLAHAYRVCSPQITKQPCLLQASKKTWYSPAFHADND